MPNVSNSLHRVGMILKHFQLLLSITLAFPPRFAVIDPPAPANQVRND